MLILSTQKVAFLPVSMWSASKIILSMTMQGKSSFSLL